MSCKSPESMEPKVKVGCFRHGATSISSDPLWWSPLRITRVDCGECSTETCKPTRHVSRFNPRDTQVLTPTDGGKLAAASGQKSSSSRNSCSTSCCTRCHFDIEPFLGVTARAAFSAGSLASVVRAEEEPEKAWHPHGGDACEHGVFRARLASRQWLDQRAAIHDAQLVIPGTPRGIIATARVACRSRHCGFVR